MKKSCAACSGGIGQAFRGKDGWENSRKVNSRTREQASSLFQWNGDTDLQHRGNVLVIYWYLFSYSILYLLSYKLSLNLWDNLQSTVSPLCCTRLNSSPKQPDFFLSPMDDVAWTFSDVHLKQHELQWKPFKWVLLYTYSLQVGAIFRVGKVWWWKECFISQ